MLKQILDFQTSKNNFELLATYEITENIINIARGIALARKYTNLECERNSANCTRKDNDRTYFMAGLSEGHFSIVLSKELKKENNKNFKIISPSITLTNFKENKEKDDFLLSEQDKEVTFDLKSQYLQNSYKSLNVNVNSHKGLESRKGFYIFCIINAADDEGGHEEVYSISYYLVKSHLINEKARYLSFSNGTPFYSLSFKEFIQ